MGKESVKCVCVLAVGVCVPCHTESLAKVFSVASRAKPFYPAYVWSQIVGAHCVHSHVCSPSAVRQDFLLILTEGCKFLEGVCGCVGVWVWVGVCVSGFSLLLFTPLKPGHQPSFIIDLVSKTAQWGPFAVM